MHKKLVQKILTKRNIKNPEMFLNPSLNNLAHLESWSGMLEASTLVYDAVIEGKHIGIWGDYDVDGITSTTLAVDAISRMRGANGIPNEISWHIPDRFTEGYGMNIPNLEIMAQNGVEMIITVDCGITDHNVIKRAKELGLTVIITDHHIADGIQSEADAVCNPSLLPAEQKHELMLAGVGVIFMLMASVNARLVQKEETPIDLYSLLDLVALGTIADVADLNMQNRILVRHGMNVLSKGERVGISALKKVSGLAPSGKIRSEHIGFTLAPRMNATGRISHAKLAVEMLLSKNPDTAYALAEEMDSLNRKRKDIQNGIARQAEEMAVEYMDRGFAGLVLAHKNWHTGVAGIVASHIVEKFHVPTLICCSMPDGSYKGSGRSIQGINLYKALEHCGEHFLNFGGHPMAAGFSFDKKALPALIEAFAEAVPLATMEEGLQVRQPDCFLSVADVSIELVQGLDILEPYGPNNLPPLFESEPLTLVDFSLSNGLLTLTLLNDMMDTYHTGKRWRPSQDIGIEDIGKKIIVYYTPKISVFNGAVRLELEVLRWEWEI